MEGMNPSQRRAKEGETFLGFPSLRSLSLALLNQGRVFKGFAATDYQPAVLEVIF